MKKFFMVILIFIMMICFSSSVYALVGFTEEGDFITDGNGTITGYIGGVPVGYATIFLHIPDEINGEIITGIAPGFMQGNINLSHLLIPKTVTYIGDNAFSGCISLTEVAFLHKNGDNLIMGANVFSGPNAGLEIRGYTTSITVTNIANFLGVSFSAFEEDFTFDSNTNTITGSTLSVSTENLVTVIPNEISGTPVTAIGDSAFGLNSHLGWHVYIDEGIETIGQDAFRQDGVIDIDLPDTLTTIGTHAFAFSNLREVTIPSSVSNYGIYTFDGCGYLTDVTLEDGLTTLGSHMFYRCVALESITIPDSITSIPGETFAGCVKLATVNFPSNLTAIGDYAFENCEDLTGLTFPSTLESIGICAFKGCNALSGTTVTLSSSITSIGTHAFYHNFDKSSIPLITYESDLTIKNFTLEILNSIASGQPGATSYPSGYIISENLVDNCCIEGVAGSAAETYANTEGLSFVSSSAAPNLSGVTFADDDSNDTNSILTLPAPDVGNSFVYKISGDNNPVTTPDVGSDLSSWTPVTNGTSITVANQKNVGIAEVDSCNLAVKFVNLQAVTEAEILTLTATVSIDNTTPKFGETLTANISGDNSNSNNFSYQWYRGSNLISGAINSTYTVVEADINQTLKVEVTADDCTGSVTSSDTSVVEKADSLTPNAPTLNVKTDTTITLNSVTTNQYAIRIASDTTTALNWQNVINTTHQFTGLSENTAYNIYTRIKETATHNTSSESLPLAVTTDAKTLSSISIITKPIKTTYTKGENLDLTGLVVQVTYSDSSTDNKNKDDITSLPANNSQLNNVNVTQVSITYGGQSTTFNITVNNPILTGTVSIDNTTPKFGNTLTASISGDNSNSNNFSYQWYRGSNSISGATSSTYIVVEADISEVIKVEVTADDCMGSLVSSNTSAVEKADYSGQITDPVEESKTYNTITLIAVNGYEYSKDSGTTWNTSNTFSGLNAETEYTFNQRIKETETSKTSTNSNSLSITTESAPIPPSVGGAIVPSNGESESPAEPEVEVSESDSQNATAKVYVNSQTEDGKQTASTSEETVAALVEKAKELEQEGKRAELQFVVESDQDVKKIELNIPKDAFDSIAKDTDSIVTVQTDMVSISFDNKAIEGISTFSGEGDVSISAKEIDPSTLSKQVKAKMKDTDVQIFDFNLNIGDEKVSKFDGFIEISIPYEPNQDETSIVVYYLNDEGELELVNGVYNPETGTVDFSTNHFSIYLVGYNKVEFEDVSNKRWYYDAVSAIAAQEITEGTTETTFSPCKITTRAEYVTLIVRYFDFSSDSSQSYVDVKENLWYSDSVVAAKELDILPSIYGDKFKPYQAITREEMMYIIYRGLVVSGNVDRYLDEGYSLDDFIDKDDVSDYAVESVEYLISRDVIHGTNGMLLPSDTATRAEVAQMLYNLLLK